MFKFLNKITNSATKSTISGIDTEAIKKAKEQLGQKDDKRHEDANKLFNEAIDLIERFDIEKKDELLYNAASKLDLSLKYNNHSGEAYFWLAYIFFIFVKYRESIKYLKIAEDFAPNYIQIQQLKKFLSEVKI